MPQLSPTQPPGMLAHYALTLGTQLCWAQVWNAARKQKNEHRNLKTHELLLHKTRVVAYRTSHSRFVPSTTTGTRFIFGLSWEITGSLPSNGTFGNLTAFLQLPQCHFCNCLLSIYYQCQRLLLSYRETGYGPRAASNMPGWTGRASFAQRGGSQSELGWCCQPDNTHLNEEYFREKSYE